MNFSFNYFLNSSSFFFFILIFLLFRVMANKCKANKCEANKCEANKCKANKCKANKCQTCGDPTFRFNSYCKLCFKQLLENTREQNKPLLSRLKHPESKRHLSAHFLQQLHEQEVDTTALVIMYYDCRLWTLLSDNFSVSVDDYNTLLWSIQHHPDFKPVLENVLRGVFYIQK